MSIPNGSSAAPTRRPPESSLRQSAKGRHAVGLQGQMSPAINYAKDLIADGYVDRVLSATMIAAARTGEPRSTAPTMPTVPMALI
jgi:predicted dehydrogenase